MNEIEKLRMDCKNISNNCIKDIILDDKYFPHYPALNIRAKSVKNGLKLYSTVYSEKLQDSLMKYPTELEKMLVIVHYIRNNNQKFKNNGGFVSIGLNFKAKKYKTVDVNGFVIEYEDNNIADKNRIQFSALKGLSVFTKYIFGKIKEDSMISMYDYLSYEIKEVMKEVMTFTIVYITSENTIREVTKHDFGIYGNILTSIELELEN